MRRRGNSLAACESQCGGAVGLPTPTMNSLLLSRRRVIGSMSALAFGPAFGAAMAQAPAAYPSRPISLWIPWPAGGATDLSLRVLAELAARLLGVKIIIENRGGAGGTLAMPVL